jgi:hypothetical protein
MMTFSAEFDDWITIIDEGSEIFKLRQKEAEIALKKLHKNYEKYTIHFNKSWSDGKFYKKITIENWGSGAHGTLIKNAVTGVKYDVVVGSEDEDLLFRVTDSTARKGRREPVILYYDSPEQYENHHFTKLSQEIKQRWNKRSMEVRKRLNLIE